MIVRFSLTCDTCGAHHTPRVQLGHGRTQAHTFACKQCQEPITVSLKLFPEEGSWEIMAPENASLAKEKSDSNLVYLNPSFPAESDQIGEEMSFPSIPMMQQIMASDRGKEMLKRSKPMDLESYMSLNVESQEETWQIIESAWRLEEVKNFDFAKKKLTASRSLINKNLTRPAFREFVIKTYGINVNMKEILRQAIEKNPDELFSLASHYMYCWEPEFRRSEKRIFSRYFSEYDMHGQVSMHLGFDLDISSTVQVTTFDYDRVIGFYAEAFEFFSRQVVILTALHNIICGRKFKDLQNIMLQKYEQTDKARRCENFNSHKNFVSFITEYANELRNAVYHNWVRNDRTQKKIFYKTSENSPEIALSYTDYIVRCGRLFRQIAQLIVLSMELEEVARTHSTVRNLHTKQ